MPLTPYSRPQDTITQILRATPAPVINRRNALVIGPQYKLMLNDGRELSKKAFVAAGQTLHYETSTAGVTAALNMALFTPQLGSVRVFGENLEAQVSDTITAIAMDAGYRSRMRLATNNFNGGTLNTGLRARPVQVGDVFKVHEDLTSTTTKRKVLSLLPRTMPAVVPTHANAADGSTYTPISVGGTYTDTVNRTLILEIVTGGDSDTLGVIRVYDSAGFLAVQTFGVSPALGSGAHTIAGTGLTFTVADSTVLAQGARFYIPVAAAYASATQFDGVVLDGPVVPVAYNDNGVEVIVYQGYTGEITVDNANGVAPFTIDTVPSNGVATAPLGLSVIDTGANVFAPFSDTVGSVFLSYKANMLTASDAGVITVRSAADISTLVGEVNDENWLGRGVFEAFSGAQGNTVYALRTDDDTVDAFAAALKKIRSTDIYYALAVMTDDQDVMKLVTAHCEEMSNKFNRNFRRCYVGTDSPGQYTRWGALSSGGLRQASLANGLVTLADAYRAGNSFISDASVGDFISIAGLGDLLKITGIVSDHEVAVNNTTTGISGGGIKLIRKDSANNTVKFLCERASALHSRRCVNVWTDYPTYQGADGSVVMPMKFVAAEIAGLRCALMPQQGLTMTEIASITSAPAMYNRFTPEQLDTIASYGNMIVTQEVEGGVLFIRHQLTTDVADGALAYEDNVGVIVDTFSFYEKDLFRGYLGKRNVTPDTIEDIRVNLKQLALDATRSTLASAGVGPLIIRFFDEDGKEGNVTVRVDSQLADRLITYVKLRVPLPLNGIDHYIDVETSTLL